MTDFHPAPFNEFSAEMSDPGPVVRKLRMELAAARRYTLGAENLTGHMIDDLLDRLPSDDVLQLLAIAAELEPLDD